MTDDFNPDWECKPGCVASEVLKERLAAQPIDAKVVQEAAIEWKAARSGNIDLTRLANAEHRLSEAIGKAMQVGKQSAMGDMTLPDLPENWRYRYALHHRNTAMGDSSLVWTVQIGDETPGAWLDERGVLKAQGPTVRAAAEAAIAKISKQSGDS